MTYELRESLPDPETFVALRDAAGMTPRSVKAVRRGLPNTIYGVTVVEADSEETIGMARIVGDGACVYHISDMVVHPDHQRRGLGSRMMDALMAYIDDNAPETAYVNLMADVDGFYEQWGFERTVPASKGMYLPQ
ncbi:Acetyltransferase (GNAT) domain-containing protein [Halovenus aranensis]|jgi:GNAT superfamily N-acetyltransferase|uniref:Acetyltransferase (GNAT) domain-containing protein n=1 Tax=Halovenus aranensis TaxID=890420 RepID=A0A1G8XGG1_9EURY|nr:GNAT family N-acetyltransferase [Halovenus aranensis]SDJ89526.1 Acetyltransferase (GNAT) domain-containing protein [Halovenus aranensis]